MKLHTTVRFMLVGALGTWIDFSVFALLHLWLGVPTLLANTFSYGLGIVNNYILHRRWTFAHRPRRSTGKQFSQFAGVSLSALLINNVIVLLLTPVLSKLFAEGTLAVYLAKMAAIGVGMLWNLLANYLWIFRAAPALAPGEYLHPDPSPTDLLA